MILFHQSVTAILLITLTLVLQAGGMAALTEWIKAQFPHGLHQLGLFRSFLFVVRFTTLLVFLHMSEILLWASFYRGNAFSLGVGILFLRGQLRTNSAKSGYRL